MTGHGTPTDQPLDPSDAAVDHQLGAAFDQARATTPRPDRHAFLAVAHIRRNRLRRRRRAWTVAVPIAAAALVLVAVGIIASSRNDTSMDTATVTGSQTTAAAGAQTATGCPEKPDDPNTEPGEAMFAFTPDALILCTYGVDGRLVATNAVPGPEQASVEETLDYIQRAYVDRPVGSQKPHCTDDAIAVDRIGVVATDGDAHATAWIAAAGCSTPPEASGDVSPESGSGPATTNGSTADGPHTSPPNESTEATNP